MSRQIALLYIGDIDILDYEHTRKKPGYYFKYDASFVLNDII